MSPCQVAIEGWQDVVYSLCHFSLVTFTQREVSWRGPPRNARAARGYTLGRL